MMRRAIRGLEKMRVPLALIFYCFLFSTLFVLFYSFISQQESKLEIITRKDWKINLDDGDKRTSLQERQSALGGADFEKYFVGR